jgi:hypothetical protein
MRLRWGNAQELRASLLATMACAAISVGTTTAYAQAGQNSAVVLAQTSDARIIFMNLDVHIDRPTLWPAKGASSAAGRAMRWDDPLQRRSRSRSGAGARSKKRVIAGAIIGGVGGFFAGGFLGAHIEGDRCNCDDPGVRGFLIGAPIGAVAASIVGAKFLF